MFINSDLLLSVSMRSLGPCCVNINAVTSLSHFGEKTSTAPFLPPSCHGTILKNETRKPSEAGLDHLSFGFQMTSLNEPFLSFSQSFGARLWCQELSFYISDGSYYIVYKESDGVCFCGGVFFRVYRQKRLDPFPFPDAHTKLCWHQNFL